jgi:hypothetical protein
VIKLNLGCGSNKLGGYVNVDLHGEPDVRHDLEAFPWPFEDNTVTEVVLKHVLEHLGASPAKFIGILQELYRVATPGAVVHIAVPHPRHDHFIGDPTHVRVVTPEVISLFSKANCRKWQKEGGSNSPLALYYDVDFELRETRNILDEPYATSFAKGELSVEEINRLARERNNIILEIHMKLEVIK